VSKSPLASLYPSVNWETMFRKTGELANRSYDWSASVADIKAPTLLMFADADMMRPEHVVEFYKLLGGGQRDAGLDGSLRYFLRLHIGNVALFLTGFFPDFIYQRSKRKAAPPIEYYESIGRMQYESAATQSLAYDEDAAPVLQTLADRFVDIRSAMNVCSDARLHLNSRKHSVEVIERQASTLDEESFRRSIDS